MSLTVGVPTRISSPSAMSKTRSKSNLLPASTGRRSTSMVRPSTARYCLPPLSTIANLIIFSSHSLHRVPAEFLHSSPANGEAGFSLSLDMQLPQNPTTGVEAHGIIHVRKRSEERRVGKE